jgi:hypothetical protein
MGKTSTSKGYYTGLHSLKRAVLPACSVQLPLRGALDHEPEPLPNLLVVVVFEERIEQLLGEQPTDHDEKLL